MGKKIPREFVGKRDHHISSKNITTYGEENLNFFPYNTENEKIA